MSRMVEPAVTAPAERTPVAPVGWARTPNVSVPPHTALQSPSTIPVDVVDSITAAEALSLPHPCSRLWSFLKWGRLLANQRPGPRPYADVHPLFDTAEPQAARYPASDALRIAAVYYLGGTPAPGGRRARVPRARTLIKLKR